MDGLRISEHASDNGRWRISSLAPSGHLASYVNGFHACHEQDTPFRRRRELPDGSAVLIFNLGKELRVDHPARTVRAFGEGHGDYGDGCIFTLLIQFSRPLVANLWSDPVRLATSG
jgi:hypothetical protein